MEIVFNFHASETFLSKAIRTCSDGKFSHVSMWVDGKIYEAHIKKGVRKYKADWDSANDIVTSIYVPVTEKQLKQVKKFLEAQVGKKYDLLGVLSFIWFFLKAKKGQWYCSELAMVALMKLWGIKSSNYDQKQSPYSFYLTLLMLLNVQS